MIANPIPIVHKLTSGKQRTKLTSFFSPMSVIDSTRQATTDPTSESDLVQLDFHIDLDSLRL